MTERESRADSQGNMSQGWTLCPSCHLCIGRERVIIVSLEGVMDCRAAAGHGLAQQGAQAQRHPALLLLNLEHGGGSGSTLT